MIKKCKNCGRDFKAVKDSTRFCRIGCAYIGRRLDPSKPVAKYSAKELKEYNSNRYQKSVRDGSRGQYNREYYLKNKEKMNKYSIEYYFRNKDDKKRSQRKVK